MRLHCREEIKNMINEQDAINQQLCTPLRNGDRLVVRNKTVDAELINKISDFVDAVRDDMSGRPRNQQQEDEDRPNSVITVPGQDLAQHRTEQTIIEAEKFKASIEKPTGTNNSPGLCDMVCDGETSQNDMNMQRLLNSFNKVSTVPRQKPIGKGLSDDDFFHLTCQVDEALKQKIENGEYVDLDKLLPKAGPFDSRPVQVEGSPLQWIQREGGTYLMPAKKSSRINSFRRWEQAFRIYATIYCSENPNRSREIWQYISVINTAATGYVRENVYNYDITFRQLMEFNPARSWAVTYNQMWNLAMREPLPKSQNQGQNNRFSPGGSMSQGQAGPSAHMAKKPKYCWSFNRGIKCRFGNRCRFIERCSYCDSPSHPILNCHKLDSREKMALSNSWGSNAAPTQMATQMVTPPVAMVPVVQSRQVVHKQQATTTSGPMLPRGGDKKQN